MVVKMRWPWPPPLSKKFEVKLVVKKVEDFHLGGLSEGEKPKEGSRVSVEIRWKGPKFALSSLRRTVKRNFTKEEELKSEDGLVEWNEDFQNVCNISAYKENVFHPWEISFTVLNNLSKGQKNKVTILGTASLNLADFVSATEEKEAEVSIPLSLSGGTTDCHPALCLSLSLLELRTVQETPETVQRPISPIPLSPRSGETLSTGKDEHSALKAGLRKVKILKEYVSNRRAKKPCSEEEGSEGRCSVRSEEDYIFPFDTDSHDDFNEKDTGEEDDSTVRKSFNYGTLAATNCLGGSYNSEIKIKGEDEDWIYYSNHKSDVGCSSAEEPTTSLSEPPLFQSSRRMNILSWRKRKLHFRSPKAKGEPLLKKAYAEEGGDDIDYDRRQLSSSDESAALPQNKSDEEFTANRSSVSEFGDDNFSVGSWEQKEITSRDGHMKLRTQVFFASIDQRSERAAGESACTALVAVISNWFQTNRDSMPIKSQFDTLIREGSLEWRNLCEIETYRNLFPDKHFDLETVLQAKIRPISIASEKSFVGFFYPDGMEEGAFEFLHGAMSFDGIWDEISSSAEKICFSNGDPQVYIVSWNDHFFVLKVEHDAYYIIDTLGERLYEGCSEAYILKFDKDTTIHRLPEEAVAQAVKENQAVDQQIVADAMEAGKAPESNSKELKEEVLAVSAVVKADEFGEEEIVCKGKESCKEYIKSFLAAIPIRELQADIRKGRMGSTPLHQRLQIEFHYIEFVRPISTELVVTEAVAAE